MNNSLLLPLLLQSHLKEIQVAFISVLSDPDGKKRVLSNQMVRSVCSLLTPASAFQMYLFNITKRTETLACSLSFLSPHPSFFFFFHLELSQDVASKGLGLVYEMGGEGDQQKLVSTLVETLMTGKR